MRRTETVALTRAVKALCPHQAIDEYTPDVWHDVIGHLEFAECMAAVAEVNARQPFIAPSDIITEIAARRGREMAHSQACRASACRECLFGGDEGWCMCTCHPRAVKALAGPRPKPVPGLAVGPRRFDPAQLTIGRTLDE